MKPFIARLYVFLIMSLLLTACGVRDVRYAPHGLEIRDAVLPPDVASPAVGVRPALPNSDLAIMCCALEPSAHFRVKKLIRNARVLLLSVYWPDGGSARSSLTVRIENRRPMIFVPHAGFNTLRFKLRPVEVHTIGHQGFADVSVRIAGAGDTVHGVTGVTLTSVYFE